MELSRRDFGSSSSITIFMQGLCREKSLENLKLLFGKNRVFFFLSSGPVKLDETGTVLTMSPGRASLRPYVWLQTSRQWKHEPGKNEELPLERFRNDLASERQRPCPYCSVTFVSENGVQDAPTPTR